MLYRYYAAEPTLQHMMELEVIRNVITAKEALRSAQHKSVETRQTFLNYQAFELAIKQHTTEEKALIQIKQAEEMKRV